MRFFDSKLVLTTTPQTTFNVAEDAAEASPAVRSDAELTVGQILQMEVTSNYLCPQRHALPNVNSATLMTRCERCSKYCKNSKLTSLPLGSIVVQDEKDNQLEFIVDDKLLRSLVTVDANVSNAGDHIVQNVMQHDKIEILARGKRAIAVSFYEDQPKPRTSAQLDEQETQEMVLLNQETYFLIHSPDSPDSFEI